MLVHFSKYHGTGNDFVMVDGRELDFPYEDEKLIQDICHRRFGVGADGLIVLGLSKGFDFAMKYFNADGREGSMCGNGGRCIVAFARQLGLTEMDTRFEGIDGVHSASFLANGHIRLKLSDVEGIRELEDGYLLNTGSPHFVKFVRDLESIEMNLEGKKIRHESRFGKEGVNVNFVEELDAENTLFVRTFERGVESETWSCGTGVTAAAISSFMRKKTNNITYHILTRGGELEVDYRVSEEKRFTDVYLSGPVSHVYDGTIQT